MSDKGSPSDPFGRSDRTIIRPNPGGRRVAPPAAPAPQQPYNPPTPQPYTPAPAAYNAPAAAPAGTDDWIHAPPPVPQAAPVVQAQPPRDQLLTPNANPLLRAAGPLLVLLGRLRAAVSTASPAQLLGQASETIEGFDQEVRAAGVPQEQARAAKYILCATADDIVQNIPGEDRHVWTQYSMLSRFFGERVGGVRFFEELDRAKADPSVNYNLLELMHACLALGFQGIHRTSASGTANLQTIQRNLYETLRKVKQPDPELSPRWQGQAIASAVQRFRIPVWSVAAVASLLLLGLYFIFRALLGGHSEAAASALIAVHPTGELGIQRKVFSAPPPPVPQPQAKVCATVKPPIICQVTPNLIIVKLIDITLFEPGQAKVREEFRPLIERIATVLNEEGGAIRVVGHSDSSPIRTARFPNNTVLSLERAKAVAALVTSKLNKPDRMSVDGKGPDVPIAPNTTADGRAKNRRVEILIQRNG